MSRLFANPLEELAEFEEFSIQAAKGNGPLLVSGCLDSQKVHLMEETGPGTPFKLVITYDEPRAREIAEDFQCFRDDVYLFPPKDLLFYSADIRGNLITKDRLRTLRHLLEDDSAVVVTTIDALLSPLPSPEKFAERVLKIETGAGLDLDAARRTLEELGYERTGQVNGMGQFSVRGGILDIFPLTEEQPVRIELWDTEVDSIRSFDAESQRSLEALSGIEIYPAAELVPDRKEIAAGLKKLKKEVAGVSGKLRAQMKTEQAHRLSQMAAEAAEGIEAGFSARYLEAFSAFFLTDPASFLAYLPAGGRIFVDEPTRIRERAQAVEAEFAHSMEQRALAGQLLPSQKKLLFDSESVLAACSGPETVYVSGLEQKAAGLAVKARFSIHVQNANSYTNNFELLIRDLQRFKKDQYRVVLLTASRTRASRLAADLRGYGLSAYCPDAPGAAAGRGEILVVHGSLHRGFMYPLIKFAVLTEGDIFGTRKKKKRGARTAGAGRGITGLRELSPGDYVICEEHGLGIYRGIEQIEREQTVRDYLKIEYAAGSCLYLPVTRLDGIQKYAAPDAKVPKLNRLGGDQWRRTKERVRTAVRDIAADLVRLYAARQLAEGYAYEKDTVWQQEFEELFPYEVTEDQAAAIADTKRDMESKKVMDRLICGDVGYGKTEVALRAAFKAVQENKQVVFLAPTTILAQQHYNTFVQRLKDFPVRVDLLSRFRTAGEIKKTLEDLRRGQVDILVGTHRVLSKDVVFKDLGLLVIDEEQRFGVAHKEQIKQLKQNVDVLTLTATPIPRTLQMSLSGIRDLSVLEEPPVDRVPIQTYVMEYNEEMIREAVARELARGGQVFYVYNRVRDIADVAARIQQLSPEASVVCAHGQMPEQRLEQIMLDFVNGDIDVLVSTTIIETGLDIPNANTILIQDADRMGLAQLYQLRGRVGRSGRTAYAFLLYRRDKILREEAVKRLQAIREFTEFGSGIRIAMRDLEIRGAGNVLGAEQHGHMEAVGYDLYCKLLNQAVQEAKGLKSAEDRWESSVDCEMSAYIPDSYIRNEYQKLDIYKRISLIENEEEYLDMQDELMDRFGEIPKPASNLLLAALLKSMAQQAYVTEVKISRQEIRLTLHPQAKLDIARFPDLFAAHGGALTLRRQDPPTLIYMDGKNKNRDADPMLAKARELLHELQGCRLDPAQRRRN